MNSNVNIMKGMNFDSSLSDIDAAVSPEEYKERLISLLQPILDATFPDNPGKQKIRVYNDRISFACPYCGDSIKSNHKKRGNFILKGKYIHYFKCHNCGEAKRIDNFFKDFNKTLDLSVINYISKGINNEFYQTNYKYDVSLFLDMDVIDKYAIDRQKFKKSFGLTEVKESSAWPWLKNRLQFDYTKFLYNSRENYLVILNLTPSGKILGVQKRPFKKGTSKYLTYKLDKLYELLNKDSKNIPEEINDISQIFNICLLNYSRPITLFEGPFDAFLFQNSIANTGIHKHFPIEIPLQYWFDDDKDGREASIEKINNGESVFLWTKLRRDFELPVRDKWDLNDCVIYFHEKQMRLPNFNLYFSNNPLDLIDV